MRRDLYRYIVITISIVVFWICIIPLIFTRIVPVVCDNLSYNSPYIVKIEEPKLYLNIIPVASIKAKKIYIKSKNDESNLLIEQPWIRIRILPLLSGHIHIDRIGSEKIDLNANFNTDAVLDKNFLTIAKTTKVICDYVDIKKIRTNLKRQDINQSAILLADNILYINNGRFTKFNLKSEISINNAISKEEINIYLPKNNNVKKSIIDIHILNLDIAPIFDYMKNYLPKDFVTAKGTIGADIDNKHLSAVFKNIEIRKKDDAKSIIFPKELSIVSGLSLTRKEINIDNAELKSKNIDAVIGGTISNYLERPIPSYNLDIRVNKSKIEDFIGMLPVFKTEDIDSYKLKKYKFYGDILGNFSVKGDNLEPSINGHIFVNNGVLTKPIPNASGACVKLEFKGKYLNFDVAVPAGYSEKVNVVGGVELYNVKYADMRVWSTKNVDLATAEEKVVPIHEILNFVIGPVPIMDIKGTGNIDINIKGNRKNPHIWGTLNFKNTTAKFNEIPDLVLNNADAILKFDDEGAVFNLKHGLLNDKDINIDGDCTLSGKFDFDVQTKNQKLEDLYKSIKTSTMINEVKNMIPAFDTVQGMTNLKLKVYGNIKNIEDTQFNKNFFSKGNLELLGNTFKIQDIIIHNTTGLINFDNTNAQMELSSFIGNSPLNVTAIVNDKYADAVLSISKLNLSDIVPKTDKFLKEISNIYVNVKAKYKGRTDIIEYEKADLEAQILNVAKNNKLKLSNGKILLKNEKLQINNLNGNFENSNSMFKIDVRADNIFSKPMINGTVHLKDFELYLMNHLCETEMLPSKIREIINSIKFKRGKINLNAKISNNNINASTNIGGVEFVYMPLNLPVKVINGSVYMRKNYLGLNKINIMADDIPVLIDGGIDNIFAKKDFNLYLNTKPNQIFVDKYINNNRLYPLKIKGDIVCLARMRGTDDNFNMEVNANLAKDSSIYYLGATVGDIENGIILSLDMNVINKNILKIKEFSYDKLIDSLGKKQTRLNMLKSSGGIDVLKDDFIFKDLRVKTSHPTDIRILNILFKKPNIKQGQFSSDLKINGNMTNPHITGSFYISETDIPFFDTTMKTLTFVFKDKTIELLSKGEVFGNDIIFKGILKNKTTPPYYIESAELYTKDIDMNYITYKLKTAQANVELSLDSLGTFDIKNAVIKNLKLKADRIKLRNITATNVEANIALNEKNVFNIEKFKFNAAQGSINGRFSYNLVNDNTWIHLNAKDINANDMAVAMFDLNNQIYGDLTGNVKLSCNGADFNKCMSTLNGSLDFDVKDGRMPKLGSLEHLIKAGNLVKSGLTGMTLNNVIDVLVPLKTGNFSEIYGKMSVKNGVTNDIEIASKGNDLSLFIAGSYNFGTSNAEMEVLGILSKKISTMLGPLGNVSLNTLFNIVPGIDLAKDSSLLDKINKIPGIELNSKAFRKFIAEINGNINGENYVKSFKWIN